VIRRLTAWVLRRRYHELHRRLRAAEDRRLPGWLRYKHARWVLRNVDGIYVDLAAFQSRYGTTADVTGQLP
jgi:hypothetical protein